MTADVRRIRNLDSGCVLVASADLVAAIDDYMGGTKLITGSDTAYAWRTGYSEHEVAVDFPIQFSGELAGKLMVVGFPRSTTLKFRLCLCFDAAICRLDYTDETHPNSLRPDGSPLPAIVHGPHYHSWPLNRGFFRGVSAPPRLHLAEEFTNQARTFDSILRWFCADTKIEGLPPNHLIRLPTSDRFL